MLLVLPRSVATGGAEPVSLAGLRSSSWATARAGTAYADMFDRVCRSVGGFEPDVRHRVNDMRLLLELVAGGRGAALVPALGHPERDTRVAVRRIAEGGVSRALFVAVRTSDRSRPATAAVVAAIVSAQRSRNRPADRDLDPRPARPRVARQPPRAS